MHGRSSAIRRLRFDIRLFGHSSLGWGLAFRAGVGVVIALMMLARRHRRASSAEERLLSETFGAEYDRYRARTWRLVPFVY